MPQQPERATLAGWEALEGGEVRATVILPDGRRLQLLVHDQQLDAAAVLDHALLAAALVPRPTPAMLDVT